MWSRYFTYLTIIIIRFQAIRSKLFGLLHAKSCWQSLALVSGYKDSVHLLYHYLLSFWTNNCIFFVFRFASWISISLLGTLEILKFFYFNSLRRHHLLNGHKFVQTPRDSEGPGSLSSCSRTWLDWTTVVILLFLYMWTLRLFKYVSDTKLPKKYAYLASSSLMPYKVFLFTQNLTVESWCEDVWIILFFFLILWTKSVAYHMVFTIFLLCITTPLKD